MNGQCQLQTTGTKLLGQSSDLHLIETWREESLVWARLFGLAAMFYLHEPVPETVRAGAAAGQALAEGLPEERFVHFLNRAAGEIDEVRQEFFDLFFVPVSGCYCPPFGGISGQGLSADNGGVGPVFGEAGFEPARLPGLPSYLRSLMRPDYIGFELAFLANILEAAATEPDEEKAGELYETGRFFQQNYLAPWAADFGSQVAERAQSHYFRACGHLTRFLSETFMSGGPAL